MINQRSRNSLSTITLEIIHQAIQRSEQRLVEWRQVPAPQRAQILRKIAEAVQGEKEHLAHLMAEEMGKTLRDGRAEVAYTADYFNWFAGEAERIYTTGVPSNSPHKQILIHQEPIGVCAAITPWNFPLAMAARKIAPALAAGCTILVKPAPECPRSLQALVTLATAQGLPEDCLQVLIGDEQLIGQSLLKSPVIRKLSFTGSCEVGRLLYAGSSETLKKLTLELGGHAPLIVCEDAEISLAVQESVKAKFRNNGQTCIAATRFFIQQSVLPAYLSQLKTAVSQLRIGSPFDVRTEITTTLHPSVEDKIRVHLVDALDQGAKLEYGGEFPYQPTILSGVKPHMLAFQEETFGPLISILSFDRDEEAIALANQNPYGLAGYLFTRDLKRMHRLTSQLQVGVIGVNDGAPSAAQISFGGIKDSGFGREGGPFGLREYLVDKCLSINYQ